MCKHSTQKYFIFTKRSLNKLEAAVNEAIESGWALLGAPFAYPVYVERTNNIPEMYAFENCYAQAMVFKMDKWIKQPPTPPDTGGLGMVDVDGRDGADEADEVKPKEEKEING